MTNVSLPSCTQKCILMLRKARKSCLPWRMCSGGMLMCAVLVAPHPASWPCLARKMYLKTKPIMYVVYAPCAALYHRLHSQNEA